MLSRMSAESWCSLSEMPEPPDNGRLLHSFLGAATLDREAEFVCCIGKVNFDICELAECTK